MSLVPLDPFSLVVDEKRKWTPDWYQWLQDLTIQATRTIPPAVTLPPLDWIRFTAPACIRQGLNAGSFDGTRLYVNPGTLSDAGGSHVYSSNQNSLPHFLDVSTLSIQSWDPVTVIGSGATDLLGGMMVSDGVAVDGDTIFLVIVARDSDNRIELMGSKTLTYSLTLPSGWHVVRLLPYAFKYRTVWGGLPDFFTGISGDNRVLFSRADFSSTYLLGGPLGGTGASASGTFNAWTNGAVASPILTLFMNTRVSMNPANVAAGTAGFAAVSTTPFPAGQVNAAGDNVYGETILRTDTSGGFKWSTTGGAQLSVYLKGYWFEEPV